MRVRARAHVGDGRALSTLGFLPVTTHTHIHQHSGTDTAFVWLVAESLALSSLVWWWWWCGVELQSTRTRAEHSALPGGRAGVVSAGCAGCSRSGSQSIFIYERKLQRALLRACMCVCVWRVWHARARLRLLVCKQHKFNRKCTREEHHKYRITTRAQTAATTTAATMAAATTTGL